jgi:hypothetical protein
LLPFEGSIASLPVDPSGKRGTPYRRETLSPKIPRLRFFEEDSKNPKLDGACYSEYVGEPWRGKGI